MGGLGTKTLSTFQTFPKFSKRELKGQLGDWEEEEESQTLPTDSHAHRQHLPYIITKLRLYWVSSLVLNSHESCVPASGVAESGQPQKVQPIQIDCTLTQHETFPSPPTFMGFFPMLKTNYLKSF